MDCINPNSGSVSTTFSSTRPKTSVLRSTFDVFRAHWPEYSIEATLLGFFMLSACTFTVLLFHPASVLTREIPSMTLRRVLMGLAMGTTAISIFFSPLGKRSGAHINPAVTLTFLRLGKVQPSDAAFYTLFQFMGGVLGVFIASAIFGGRLARPETNYAVTVPGPNGTLIAFLAEVVISFLLMTVVLNVSNTRHLSRWTGLFAGALVATYISLEAPLSGMSMNPARTFGSAFAAHVWTALWIYFTAPPIGMLLAAELYRRLPASHPVVCAKFHHHNNQRCIFNCNWERFVTAATKIPDLKENQS